jgi:hypothetical protein
VWNYDPTRANPAPRHPSGSRQTHVSPQPQPPA